MKHLLFFTLIISTILYPMDNEKTPLLSNQKNEILLNLIDSNDTYNFEKTLAIKDVKAKKVVFDRNDSNILYSGSSDKTIKIWDINKNTCTEMQPELNQQRTDIIAINSDGTRLAACGWNRSIALFNPTQKKFEKTLKMKKNKMAFDALANQISCLAFSHKNSRILAAGLEGDYTVYGQKINTIGIFNTENNEQNTLTSKMFKLTHVAMDPHDEQQLIATSYRKITFWNIETKKYHEIHNEYDDCRCIRDIIFHPTKNIFITFTSSYLIDIWSVNEKRKVRQIKTKGFGQYGLSSLAIHPDGNKIIATGHRLTQILNFHNDNVIQTLPNKSSFCGRCFCSSSINSPKHNDVINQVALSNDGKNLATVAGTIKIWNQN